MYKYIKIFKLILIFLLLFLIVIIGVGCNRIFFIPGASYGYYIWEDKDNNIHIVWSIDRKDASFNGWIAMDGEIRDYKTLDWEENDNIKILENNSKIEFNATLSEDDYSDEIIFTPIDYSYLEFDLKINDNYELSRINIGEFVNNPNNNIFRIEKNYFSQLKEKPWYKIHPFSEFFKKLYVNKIFTLVYVFILGAIIIEVLRIGVFYNNKRKTIYLIISYIILIFVDFGIYLFLKKVV